MTIGIIFQRPFALYLVFSFTLFVSNISSASALSLADRKLLKIIEQEKEFFSLSPVDSYDAQELSRKAQDLVALYEAHLSENPNDTNALILYGKFLNRVGQENHAISFFLKADSINPKIAVVKQQIGNFLVEKNKPLEALPFFTETIKINPSVADYHFHLGNFLVLFQQELTDSKILGMKSIESFAHDCFGQAAQKKPSSFEYRLRYAQSFFDYSEADYSIALKEWKGITNDFESSLSKSELDYIKLCKARIMLELNQKDKATALINEVSSKSLAKSKKVLLQSISEKPKAEKPKANKTSQKKTGYLKYLIHDPHLARLKHVTEKLREENLIKQLEADRIRIKHDASGNIQLIVNQDQQR